MTRYITDFLENLCEFTDGEINLGLDEEIRFNYTVNDKEYQLKGTLIKNGLIKHLQVRDPYWKDLANYLLDHKEDEAGTFNIHDFIRDLKDITIFNLLDDDCFELKTAYLTDDERATIQATIDCLQGLLNE